MEIAGEIWGKISRAATILGREDTPTFTPIESANVVAYIAAKAL